MASPPSMPQLSPEDAAADQGQQLLAVFIIFTILPISFTAMRIAARSVSRMKLWWDDYLVLAAVMLYIVQFALLNLALKTGLGRHIQAIPLTNLEPYLFYTYLSELVYATSITLVKCSILCLYMRVFSINTTFRKVCYGLLAFVLVWGVTVFFVTVFQCTPVRGAWNKMIPDEQCFDLKNFVIGTNVPNIIADAAIIITPIPLVWKLQLSLLRKVGVIAVFGLAAITTIISILRVTFNAHIDVMDPTWNFVKVAVLSTVEISIGICCACLPVAYPLFRVLVGRSIRSNPASKGSGGRGYTGSGTGAYYQGGGKISSTGGSNSDERQLWEGGSAWTEPQHGWAHADGRDTAARGEQDTQWARGDPRRMADRDIPLRSVMVTHDLHVARS